MEHMEDKGREIKGLVHIYCGDGKGKTTAALGLALRAAGRKKKVLIVRFLKTDDSGEVSILKRIPEITLIPCEKTFGFLSSMSEETKKEAIEWYGKLLERAISMAIENTWDMLVMDEAVTACEKKVIEEDRLLWFLKNRPDRLEAVLTGRDPSDRLLSEADYISHIQAVRHPYEKGVKARKGIEY
ncbi:cob(I)yrinic acid a,c-diamide adenosyltransferase [Lachnospiraceae bacterium 62-35]